jgi:hypothetical protein
VGVLMVVDNELLAILSVLVADEDVVRLRRMIAESTQTPYTDDILKETIALNPLIDRNDVEPLNTYTLTIAGCWVPTWDLNGAAADVWTEKAAAVACRVDTDADGLDIEQSVLHKHYLVQARFYGSRRVATSVQLMPQERAFNGYNKQSSIVNV